VAPTKITVAIRQIDKAGDIIDRMVAAGATNINSLVFLHADTVKLLDQAREVAVADARRKAELYGRASSLALGRVVWLTENSTYTPRVPVMRLEGRAVSAPFPLVRKSCKCGSRLASTSPVSTAAGLSWAPRRLPWQFGDNVAADRALTFTFSATFVAVRRAAAVIVDELDAGRFQTAVDNFKRRAARLAQSCFELAHRHDTHACAECLLAPTKQAARCSALL
jgi:hypothetical protein